jgi:hypothetical protein
VAALPHVALRAVAVVAVLALTANGLSHMVRLEGPPGKPFEDISPRPVAPLVAALDDLGVDRAIADYCVAYRLTVSTDDRIRATPFAPVRSPDEDGAVRASTRLAYVVDTANAQCLAGIGGTRRSVDVWTVLVSDGTAQPAC